MSQGAIIVPTTPPLPGVTLVGDINSAHAAIISKFSGTAAPTLGPGASGALVAGQEWLNTNLSPNQLNVYDGTTWIPWLTLDPTNHLVGFTKVAIGAGFGGSHPAGNLKFFAGGTASSQSLTAFNGIALFDSGTLPNSLEIGGYSSGSFAIWLQGMDDRLNNVTYPIALQPSGGNVGIGTASPSAALTVGVNTASTSSTTGALVVTGGSGIGGAIFGGDAILSTSPTKGIGYATGSGGTITQATNKSTGVTLNTVCGAITMNNASLAAGTIVSFPLTDSAIAATDVVLLNHISGGTPGSYTLNAQAGGGSATINVRNNTGGALAEAIVIQFAVHKAVNA